MTAVAGGVEVFLPGGRFGRLEEEIARLERELAEVNEHLRRTEAP